MDIYPSQLFELFVLSLVVGAAVGVLYDLFRILRVMLGINRYTSAASAPVFCPKFRKQRCDKKERSVLRVFKTLVLVVQDFLFCVAAGVAISLLLFSGNNGEFRGFVPLGMAIGFSGYYFTIGKLVIHASEYLVFAIKTLFLYAVYYLSYPFIALGRFAIARIGGVAQKILTRRKEHRIRRYTEETVRFLGSAAQFGFLAKDTFRLGMHP